MKTKIFFISLFLVVFSCCLTAPQKTSAQGGYVSFQVFYDDLSPYGMWINNPDYGYVWVPNVAPGFTPYATNGYWVLTDEGWTWVSNYSWGWAPFHYGRWFTDATYGPMWVPDNEWGPGWVSWRRSSGYYGWAPIGPGVSIDVAYGNGYSIPNNQWTFVRDRDFGRTNINNYYINNSRNVTIINNSTVISNTRTDKLRNTTYNTGPARNEVEKYAGRKFTPVSIRESSKPGQSIQNNKLQIYRPQVQKNTTNGARPAPAKVAELKDVKPVKQQTPPQHINQPRDQQAAPKQNGQPAKQQQAQPQPNSQPKHQTPPQQMNQPKDQQVAPRQNGQPTKQQQAQPQPNNKPPKQQPAPQQNNQHGNPQQANPQQNNHPPHGQSPQPQQANPPKTTGEDKNPHK